MTKEYLYATAIVVTRGNVDLTPVVRSLHKELMIDKVVIYDNSKLLDFKVFSRFVAAQSSDDGNDYVYVQDDDVIVDLEKYPWYSVAPSHVLCNMPAAYRPNYPGDIQLLGFGSVFHKSLIQSTFKRYWPQSLDELFLLECDRVFTALNPHVLCDVPITHLPHASAPDRLWKLPDHADRRRAIEQRIALAKAAERFRDPQKVEQK